MRPANNNRKKRLYIRVTAAESKKIHNGFHVLPSEKLVKMPGGFYWKSITVYTRNKSIDDFMTGVIALKNELNAIGNNFSQVVKKLHTIKDNFEVKTWAEINEKSKEICFQKVEKIYLKISQISGQWLQE